MITEIRSQLRSSTTRFLLWIVSFALVLSLISPLFFKNQWAGAPWAVRVNKREIPYVRFAHELNTKRQTVALIKAQLGAYADQIIASMGLDNPTTAAIDSVVHETLLIDAAEKAGLTLSPAYIAQQLGDPAFVSRDLADYLPPFVFNRDGSLDAKKVQEFLKRSGMTIQDLEEKIYTTLMRRLTLEIAGSASYVPSFEMNSRLIQEFAPRTFNQLGIARDKVLAQEKANGAAEHEVVAFFEEQNARSQRYLVPEKRAGKVWKFTPKTYGASVTDQAIERYYNEHKESYSVHPALLQVRHIRVSDKNKADEIYAQISADPKSFSALAKEFSEDATTASKGGELPAFGRGTHDAMFERAAFALKEDGALSPVIKTAEGFEILQRISRTKPTYKSLAAVSNEIRSLLADKTFRASFSADMKRLLEDSVITDQELQDFIASKQATAQRIPASTFDENSREIQELFALGARKYGFYVEGDTGVIVHLTERSKAYMPSFETIKDRVTADLYEYRTDKKLATLTHMIREKLDQGESLQTLAASLEGASLSTFELDPQNKALYGTLEKKGIPVAQLVHLDKVGLASSYATDKGNFVAQVGAIGEGNQALVEEKTPALYQAVNREYTGLALNGFLASLYRFATIDTNPVLLQAQ